MSEEFSLINKSIDASIGLRFVRFLLIIYDPILKSLSDSIVEQGMFKNFLARLEKGYNSSTCILFFH